MFTLEELPDVVFCVTQAVYSKEAEKQKLPAAYTVTHYASGMSVGNSLPTKAADDHMRAALAKMENAGFERVAKVIKAAPVLNHDAEDWLL